MAPRVFISHAAEEEAIALLTKQWLERQLPGTTAFVASKDVRCGDSWVRVLEKELPAADLVVALLTPRSIRSKWVAFEAGAGYAVARLFPIRVSDLKADDLGGPFSQVQVRELNGVGLEDLVEELVRRGATALSDKEESLSLRFVLILEIEDYLLRARRQLKVSRRLFAEYRRAYLGTASSAMTGETVPAIAEKIKRVVQEEEPVHREVVLQRIREHYGLSRAGGIVQQRFREGLNASLQTGEVKWERLRLPGVPDDAFLVSSWGRSATPRRPIESDGPSGCRAIGHISPNELREGLLLVKHESTIVSREVLLRETARHFGFSKLSRGVRRGFSRAMEMAGRAGALREMTR